MKKKVQGKIASKLPLVLKYAEIENYKSIKHAASDFVPGLNIVIGKNGSGKTNFIKQLQNVLTGKSYERAGDMISKISFYRGKSKELEYSINRTSEIINLKNEPVFVDNNSNIKFRGEIKYRKEKLKKFVVEKDFFDYKLKKELYTTIRGVSHGVFPGMNLIDVPFSFSLDVDPTKNKLGSLNDISNTDDNNPGGHLSVMLYLGALLSFIGKKKYDISSLKKTILDLLNKHISEIVPSVRLYTPINNIRVSSDMYISSVESKEEIKVRNVQFEYEVEGQWLHFEDLSDGTKRVIYIIFALMGATGVTFNSNTRKPELTTEGPFARRLLFIEEPELGVHPHQLHKLMLLLKEQSINNQIIVTTHSPQVLDALDRNEINNIIICYYDKKKGTQFRHLTSIEKTKASRYIDEVGYLSDYWLHSDFNRD